MGQGEVMILQQQFGAKDTKVVGGITYRLAPSKLIEDVPSAGAASVYLIGTYDLRSKGTTVLHIINPTAKDLRVMLAFFDDNGKPLKCVRDRLTPNDLLEIDVRKAGVKAKLGVVKVLALHETEDLPEVGVVGNQKIIRKGAKISETSLQPVQQGILRDDLKFIRKACQ